MTPTPEAAAEREAAARIVEAHCGTLGLETDALLTQIAAAIREGARDD